MYQQVDSLYDEFDKLSKKSPGDAVNKFKLKLINELIVKANEALVLSQSEIDG